MPRLRMALAMIALGPCVARSQPAAPDLDCTMGFEGLHNWAAWLPGAQPAGAGGEEVITLAEPDVWRVEVRFTQPGQTAHPAVTLRKFVKQVTGVWTAQSKGCGFGNQGQFLDLMASMKAADKTLTDASRDEAERQKKELSPLGTP